MTQSTIPCPICGKPTEQSWRPFCSKRCADVDLHRWLGEVYCLPAEENADEADSLPDAAEDGGET